MRLGLATHEKKSRCKEKRGDVSAYAVEHFLRAPSKLKHGLCVTGRAFAKKSNESPEKCASTLGGRMSDEIVKDFLVESSENLDLLDRELIKLEKDPGNRETLSSIFRTIHTIKGTCGFLGFSKLEKVAHAGENLLSLLRDGVILITTERTTALLGLVDAIRQMLDSIENAGNDGDRDDSALIDTLNRLQKDAAGGASRNVPPPAPPAAPQELLEPRKPADSSQPGEAQNYIGEAVKLLGKILVEQGTATPEDVAAAVQKQLEGDTRPLGEILLERGQVKPQDLAAAMQVQQAAKTAVAEASIRVDVTLLDRLMNLVGELVLARNQILQHAQNAAGNGLAVSSQRLNLITTELQESVMKTRMQPIGNVWSKFPRTVRDLATSCGKQVRIEMQGKETELDKTIIEAIKDPLTHLVRNSVDHGVESMDKRVAAGKSAEGLLILRAYHEGGLVSYADFITLLFAFFVVLYASSQVDKHKVSQLAEAIQDAFQKLGAFDNSNAKTPISPAALETVKKAVANPDSLRDLQAQLESVLAPEIKQRTVAMKMRKDGLVVSLREIGFFDSGSAALRPAAMNAVDRLASVVVPRTESLRIEGHTDNVPIHNAQFPSNWELSTARSTELVKLFIFRYHVTPDRLSAAGYAEFHPADDNSTSDGRARNRRIDVVVLNPLFADKSALSSRQTENPSSGTSPSPSIPSPGARPASP
jgi:flagellar motor protein MotB/HPt (histidine-containing phosphotransfer) domain-containing protein